MTEAILKYRAARGAGDRGLFPVDDEGFQILGKLKLDKDVGCDVRARRNPRQHRLFFAILKFLQLHSERFEHAPIEKIKDAVKLATGLADTFIDAETGKTYYVLRSISFGSMDQSAFNSFFDDAVSVIANRWMPAGVTAESVRNELLEMVDGQGALGSKVA
jgi:hypothetical protein